jgi:hypothetical protein
MPTLADIYSAIESAKRRGSDFVSNPVTSLQQMLGSANDRARDYNQQMVQAAQGFGAPAIGQQPTPEQMAAQQSTMQTMAEAYNPAGMTVFHGSPHVFERFDMSKLGTGEGNQSYGKGLYVAQAPEVAKGYSDRLGANLLSIDGKQMDFSNPTHIAAAMVSDPMNAGLPAKSLANALKYDPKGLLPGGTNAPVEDVIKALENGNLPSFEATKGNFYKVDLPDTHIRRMLDWDSPLKDQPAPVRNLAKSLGMDLNDLGGDLIGKIGKGDEGKQILQNAGIPGIKYLDEKSRWSPHQVDLTVKGQPYATNQFSTKTQAEQYAKEKQAEGFNATYKNVGTKNFVVFDDKHLKILERNPK